MPILEKQFHACFSLGYNVQNSYFWLLYGSSLLLIIKNKNKQKKRTHQAAAVTHHPKFKISAIVG